MQRVLILGATGLVGSEVLQQLRQLPGIKEIFFLTRRALPTATEDARVHCRVVDFDRLDSKLDCFAVDVVICAMGTTIKKAGSKDEFRRVDYSYPLQIARLAKENGAKRFILVSALGANADSKIFYNRVKGELERELRKINFANLVIARPSILLGQRAEPRPMERIGQIFSKIFPRTWRGVPAKCVASALIRSLESDVLGLTILENENLFS